MNTDVRLSLDGNSSSDGSTRRVITDVALFAAIVVGVVLTLTRDAVFPARFSYDALRIQQLAQGRIDPLGDPSYGLVGKLYSLLHLQDSPMLAGLFGYGLATAVLLMVRSRMSTQETSHLELLLVMVLPFLNAAFFGTYSKDVFVLPIVLLVLNPSRRWQAELATMASMATYGAFFRSYWLIVVVVYVCFRLRLPHIRRLRSILVTSWLGLMGAGLAIWVMFGISPDHFRVIVNASRIGVEDTATMITRFIEAPEPVGGLLNNLITQVSLLIPWRLLTIGGAYYLVLALVIMTFWFAFYSGARRWILSDIRGVDVVVSRSVAIVCAFQVVQSIFEPDYGSYLRHLTPMLFLILYVSWSQRNKIDHLAFGGRGLSRNLAGA